MSSCILAAVRVAAKGRPVSVLISHVTLAGAQGCRFMIGHINAGASDGIGPIGLAGRTPALEDSLYLGGIDPEWL